MDEPNFEGLTAVEILNRGPARFALVRDEDKNEGDGADIVAFGVQFRGGRVALQSHEPTAMRGFDSIDAMLSDHVLVRVVWIDVPHGLGEKR